MSHALVPGALFRGGPEAAGDGEVVQRLEGLPALWPEALAPCPVYLPQRVMGLDDRARRAGECQVVADRQRVQVAGS